MSVAAVVRGRKEGEARVITAESAEELSTFIHLASLRTYALRKGPGWASGDLLVAEVSTVADDLDRLGLTEDFAARLKAQTESKAEQARRDEVRRAQEAEQRAQEAHEAAVRQLMAEQAAEAAEKAQETARKAAEKELARREKAGASA